MTGGLVSEALPFGAVLGGILLGLIFSAFRH